MLEMFKLEFHPVWGKLPDQLEYLLRNLIELLAAIPSVVYGLLGTVCGDSNSPPDLQLAAHEGRLDFVFWDRPRRSGCASRLDRAVDHDSADDHRDQPR